MFANLNICLHFKFSGNTICTVPTPCLISANNHYFLRFQELETLLGEFGIQTAESESTSTLEKITVGEDEVAYWNDDTDEPQQEDVDIVNDFLHDMGDRPEIVDMDAGQNNILTETVCCCATPCLDQFTRECIERHVMSLREMDKSEKEMFILSPTEDRK